MHKKTQATITATGQITVAWGAVSGPSSGLTYRVFRSTASGTYAGYIDVGNVTSKQVVLTAGLRYYFAVQAYNTSALVSARSAEVFFDVAASTTPSITSLSSTSGSVGTAVTITGANFGATKGTSTVRFNGTVATPTTWSATIIVVPVPAGATTGNVVVTVAGVASNAVGFTVTQPGLPAPWTAQDIGSPALTGRASWASGTFTVKSRFDKDTGNPDPDGSVKCSSGTVTWSAKLSG